jgi:hypothetical protein
MLKKMLILKVTKLQLFFILSIFLIAVILTTSCSSSNKPDEPSPSIVSEMNDSSAMEVVASTSKLGEYYASNAEGGAVFKVWVWEPSNWKDLFNRYPSYSNIDSSNSVTFNNENGQEKKLPPAFIYTPQISFKDDSSFVIFFQVGMGNHTINHNLSEVEGYLGGAAFKRVKTGWMLTKIVYDFKSLKSLSIGNIYECYIGDAGKIKGKPAFFTTFNSNTLDSSEDLKTVFYDYDFNIIVGEDHLVGFTYKININYRYPDGHAIALPSSNLVWYAQNIYESFDYKSPLPEYENILPVIELDNYGYYKIYYHEYDDSKKDGLGKILLEGDFYTKSENIYFKGVWKNHYSDKAYAYSTNKYLGQNSIANIESLYTLIQEYDRRVSEREQARAKMKSSNEVYLTDGISCRYCSIGRYINGTCNQCGGVSSEKETYYKNKFKENNPGRTCTYCEGSGNQGRGECVQCLGTGVSPRVY